MSLNTILKIGKALRKSEDSLRYYKYLEVCPVKIDKERNTIYPICISIPVNLDFSFEWDKVKITPENERGDLFYLKFTTSDSDSSPKKFIFGDIFYSRKSQLDKNGKLKETKDFGNFTFEKGADKNAFLNGKSIFDKIKSDYLSNKALVQITGIEDWQEKQSFLKQILKGYYEHKAVILTKKFQKYSEKIESLLESLKVEEEEFELFKFHAQFSKELTIFNNLLLYAPAIEFILENEKDNFTSIIENENALREIQIRVNLEKYSSKLKKSFAKDEKPDNLSEETKKRIIQFADFDVFIHFDFKDGKQWYQFTDSFSLIKNKLNSEITDNTENGKVPSKNIYRTLCSGNDRNDIQFPSFDIEGRHKSFSFSDDNEFEDFLHTDSFAKKPIRKLYGTDIEFYVFPTPINDEEISASDYIDFFSKKDETRIATEPIFPSLLENENSKIKRFDFVFSDGSGNTTNDLIEISGVEKSNLRQTRIRIEDIASQIYEERKKFIRTEKDLSFLSVEFSFRNILGTPQADNKGKVTIRPNPKYQSHLLKVLPLIYTDKYYNDDVLLPAFIQNVEYSIRAGDSRYSFLKFDLKFLLKIQNNQNDKFMEITNSESYQIGLKLGRLSKPLKKAINSFEKNYVGLLTRRVSSKDDCIKFYNEINEKLVMHKKTWGQSSAEIANELANLSNSKYDKEKIAFGFLEGYFKYEVADKNKDFYTRLEKLLSDYEGNLELENEVEMLNNLYQEIKN